MSEKLVERAVAAGLSEFDARTAVRAYYLNPDNADGGRIASIVRTTGGGDG